MAAPAFVSVGAVAWESDAANQTLTMNAPASIVEGNLLVMMTVNDHDSVFTASGFTACRTYTNNSTVNSINTLYKFATGSEPGTYDAVKDDDAGAGMGGCVMQFSGVNADTPIDSTASETGTLPNSGGLTSNDTIATITPGQDNCLILTAIVVDNGVEVITKPSGDTLITSGENNTGAPDLSLMSCYRTQTTAAATGSRTFNADDNEQWSCHTIVFAPVAGGFFGNHYYHKFLGGQS